MNSKFSSLKSRKTHIYFQPYKPYIRDEMGLDNFDTQFTEEPAQLTPDVNAFRGNEFEGFEYVNPLLMTVEDQV